MVKKYTPETHTYVAVDFDGTIVEDNDFPYVRNFKPHAIETLQAMLDAGYQIMIWTCRGGVQTDTTDVPQERLVLSSLRNAGLNVGNVEVNQHFPAYYKRFKGNSPKIYADVYIDNNGYGVDKIDWLEIREAFLGEDS